MRTREIVKTGMMGSLMALVTTPAFARTIEFKEAGAALWIFVAIGAVIILLQLIPAVILFSSFIGTTVSMGIKKEKRVEEEVMVPGMEPVPVKK